MQTYIHLTKHERYYMYLMYGNKNSLTTIAKSVSRSISTIGPETKCNTRKRGYLLQASHRLACSGIVPSLKLLD